MGDIRFMPFGGVGPTAVLEGAKQADLENVVIIGTCPDQDQDLWVSSSHDRMAEVIYLLRRAEHALISED